MKLTKHNKSEPSRFSGRVKVGIAGLDQHAKIMTKYTGLASKVFVVSDTTLDEVYNIVRRAIEEHCEE